MAWDAATLGEYRRLGDAVASLHTLYHQITDLDIPEEDKAKAKRGLVKVERILTKARSASKDEAGA